MQERPKTVHPQARYLEDDEMWMFEPRNAKGQREGVAMHWRPDGSLREEYTYVGDELLKHRMFHNDGSIAAERLFDPKNFAHLSNTFYLPKGESDVSVPSRGLDPRIVKTCYANDEHENNVRFTGWDQAGAVISDEMHHRSLDMRVVQKQYASIEEASQEWNEKGKRYYQELNRFIAEIHSEAGTEMEEPEDERAEMQRLVLGQLEMLNKAGRGREARSIFAPSFEPFCESLWERQGRMIRTVAAFTDQVWVNADNEVFAIKGDQIAKVDGALRFGVSKNKRFLANCYADRVDVLDLQSGALVRRFPYPTSFGTFEGVDPKVFTRQPFLCVENLGIEKVVVSNAGTFVVLATNSGVFLMRPERAPTMVFPAAPTVLEAVRAHKGEDFGVTVDRPDAALREDDRVLVVSGHFQPYAPTRYAMTVANDLSATYTTTDENDEGFGPTVYHANGKHCLVTLPDDEGETAVATLPRTYVDAQKQSLMDAYKGTVSMRTSRVEAACEFKGEFMLGMSDCYVWRQAIDENSQDHVYVGRGGVGPIVRSMDVTPDQQEILLGTSYGAVWRLRVTQTRGQGFVTNMNLADQARYLFLRTYAPMVW